MVKHRDEKGAYSNIVLYLFLHNEEGFRRFMCMNHGQLFEQTEMIKTDPYCVQNRPAMREAIFLKQRITLTLRFLATGKVFVH